MHQRPQYKIKIMQITSGDDLIAFAELIKDDTYKKVRVRLYGVDTPNSQDPAQKEAARQAIEVVQECTKRGGCYIEVVQQSKKSWTAILYVNNKDEGIVNVNEKLIEMGYAFQNQRKRES